MSRRENFHESAGNHIVGYSTPHAAICRDCAKNDPEWADLDPRDASPIRFKDLKYSYPDGYTCAACGDNVPHESWN